MASNRLLSAKSGDSEELTVDMSPMIDMVFLLLIFFLVTSTMIIVEQDPKVKPPVASYSKVAKNGNGRIVVNIRENGDFYSEGLLKLDTQEDITRMVEEEKKKVKELGLEPKLHLRGDKAAVFKHCRTVIRASANAGVDQVLFSTFGFEN